MKTKIAVLISIALVFCIATTAVAEEKKTIKMGVLQLERSGMPQPGDQEADGEALRL